MKKFIITILLLNLTKIVLAEKAIDIIIDDERPKTFVNVSQVIPEIQLDMRYYTNHNFVGRPINGYNAPICLLTKQAANKLKLVENQLLPMGLTLKVYDCYRPQMAVDDFANWAAQTNQTQMQKEFYSTVDKANLFKQNYIAYRSGHSRGSTVDLTIVPLNSKIPKYSGKQLDCNNELPENRVDDNSLNFGTGFDCFSPLSHPANLELSPQVRANRLLLKNLMNQAGFKGLDEEWWHFTLKNEPYPTTYFNFSVEE